MLRQRLPSLVAIRAFEAAARHGGFAGAARELGTTAAAVSYHVRRLEQEIGAALFCRHAQRVTLTPAGEIAAANAAEAFALLRAGFRRAAQEDAGTLSISTLPSFGAGWLTPRLGRFRAEHPDLRVVLDLSETPQDLAGGGFDVAIRNGHGEWPGLRSHFLFPAVFQPLVAPQLRGAASLAAPALPLLGRPDWWAIWYRSQGLGDGLPAEAFHTDLAYEHLDIAAAIAGQGIAIGSPIIFADELAAGRLVPADDHIASDGRAFWLAYPRSRQNSARIAWFAEWVCAEAQAARDTAALPD